MARGWESKAVEQQLANAEDEKTSPPKARLSPQEAERQRRRDLLQSARARTLHQIECATNPRYRKLLEQQMAALDAQIRKLAGSD